MKIEKDLYIDFSDVLIKPCLGNIESRSEVDLTVDMTHIKDYMKDWKPLPIMSSNMDTVTDTVLAFELLKYNMIPVLHKYVSIEDINDLFNKIEVYNNIKDIKGTEKEIDTRNLFISRGTTEKDKLKLNERLEKEPRIQSVCIDVANGYRNSVFKYAEELRNGICKNKILMFGNVATPDAVIKYRNIGVDIVKLGIGPGSACLTRVQTGVGVPQISVIMNAKIAAVTSFEEFSEQQSVGSKNLAAEKILICSDGGCKVYGDIAKAFCAGSDFVMLGGMFAGHTESPGTLETIEGKKVKRFSGMAAKESQWNGVSDSGVEEGKTVFIPYKGKVKHTLDNIIGGLKSTCTYTNSATLRKLINNGILIRTNVQENRIFS